jgi:uncharacterized protein YtpQ (UPF0354 family)
VTRATCARTRLGETRRMRIASVALLVTLAAGCSARPAPAAPVQAAATPEDAFTQRVRERFRAAGVAAEVSAPLTLRLIVSGRAPDDAPEINLDRVFRVCHQEPERCGASLDELVASTKTVLKGAAEVDASKLFVVVRGRDYVDYVKQHTDELLAEPEPLAGDLIVLYMIDLPTMARVALKSDLAALHMNRDAAIARARQNTAARLGTVADAIKPIAENQLGYVTKDFYESSLLLQREEWDRVAKSQPGTLVVAVPAVNLLFYKWVTYEQQLTALRTITADAAKKVESPLSTTLLRWNGKGWEVVP